jgi:Methyltransferase domain
LLERNVAALLERLSPSDVVLDVGGWACPFNRAQWVLDAQPYETRGFYRTFGGPQSQGGDRECFTRDTWIVRDICDHAPWPIADKQFDFAICSHTLEDLRDPLWVCHELARVAKAGYVEVPSRLFESTLGVERPGQAGLSHHRWLIEISDNHLKFMQKYHMIHADWRFHLPARFKKRLTPETSVSWLWWQDAFSCEEVEIHGIPAMEAELLRFASQALPRPDWLYRADAASRWIASLSGRGRSWLKRSILPRERSGR